MSGRKGRWNEQEMKDEWKKEVREGRGTRDEFKERKKD